VLALSKHSDFQTKNDGQHVTDAQSLHDSGQTMNLVSDICLGAAVVAAGVTTYLYFARPTVEVASPQAMRQNKKRASIALSPSVGQGSGGIWLHGSF
jgi:hypothetical protein